jgi:chromosome segregation ATPase
VAAVADRLKAKGEDVSSGRVRQEAKGGSNNTFYEHYNSWVEKNLGKSPAPELTVPDDVKKVMTAWVTQYATEARSEAETRLAALQENSQNVLRDLREAEDRAQALDDELELVKTDRDQARATAEAHKAEINRLAGEVDRERNVAGNAQVQAAQANLKIESQEAQLADLKRRMEQMAGDLEAERKGRIEAEKQAAVLKTERDALQADNDRANSALSQAEAQQQKAQALALENADLKPRLEALTRDVARLEADLQAARAKPTRPAKAPKEKQQ